MLYWFLKALTYLPLPILYCFGDFLFVVTFYIVRWRRDIAESNLKRSFPEKNDREIHAIMRRFYRRLGVVLAETLWCARADNATMSKRIGIENPEIIKPYTDNGKSVLLMAAHYSNWEWLIFAASTHLDVPAVAVYKPIRNASLDRFIREMRTHPGSTLIAYKDFAREIVRRRKQVQAYALVADQTPLSKDDKHWSLFLHQETAFFVGTDKLAKLIKAPVFFVSTHRVKRGYYMIRLEPLTGPSGDDNTNIIENYVRLLERDIMRSPEDWLWVHKKWKYPRSPSEPLFGIPPEKTEVSPKLR